MEVICIKQLPICHCPTCNGRPVPQLGETYTEVKRFVYRNVEFIVLEEFEQPYPSEYFANIDKMGSDITEALKAPVPKKEELQEVEVTLRILREQLASAKMVMKYSNDPQTIQQAFNQYGKIQQQIKRLC